MIWQRTSLIQKSRKLFMKKAELVSIHFKPDFSRKDYLTEQPMLFLYTNEFELSHQSLFSPQKNFRKQLMNILSIVFSFKTMLCLVKWKSKLSLLEIRFINQHQRSNLILTLNEADIWKSLMILINFDHCIWNFLINTTLFQSPFFNNIFQVFER